MRRKMFNKVKTVIDEWDPIELLSIHLMSMMRSVWNCRKY